MAEMLKGGVIMDVVTPEQAKIAEDAGAVAVMALERVPADIRAQGGVARMSDPDMIEGIIAPSRSRSWPRPGSATSSRRRCLQVARRRLHRRVRGADPGRLAPTTSTSGSFTVPFVCGATNPRRGAAPARRGRRP
jgi:pyridoxal 5'-phosphate synthase pdxS subunit